MNPYERKQLRSEFLSALREFRAEYRVIAADITASIHRQLNEQGRKRDIQSVISKVLNTFNFVKWVRARTKVILEIALSTGFGERPETIEKSVLRELFREIDARAVSTDGKTIADILKQRIREVKDGLVQHIHTLYRNRAELSTQIDALRTDEEISRRAVQDVLFTARRTLTRSTSDELGRMAFQLGVYLGDDSRDEKLLDEIESLADEHFDEAVEAGIYEEVGTKGLSSLTAVIDTESNRAYNSALVWGALSGRNGDVVGLKWELSTDHPRPDICDDYAEHHEGLGEGVYSINGDIPDVPAHPRCLCSLSEVY